MDDYSNPKVRIRAEYDTQFFGFPPESLIDTLLGDAKEICEENLLAAKKRVEKVFGDKVAKKELDECFDKIIQNYAESTEKIYEKFGRYAKDHLLRIPDQVLLPEDRVHAAAETGKKNAEDSSDVAAAQEKFDLLVKRVKEAKVRKVLLETKIADLKRIRERQEKVTIPMSEELKENLKMRHLLAQKVETVEKKVERLRPLMETVENNGMGQLTSPEKRSHDQDEQNESDAKKLKAQ